MDPAALDKAYRATHDRVGGAFTLRVGERSGELDGLLADHGLTEWAYLTAHNPGSVTLPAAENRARQAALLARLAGRPIILGEAIAPSSDWEPEPSVLVLGITRDEAIEIARAFGQNAILAGERGGPVRLVWT